MKGVNVMKTYWILIVLFSRVIIGAACPSVCTCDGVLYEVRCVGRSLSAVPNDIPTETKSLILQYNSIVFTLTSSNTTFQTSLELQVLDLSWNKIEAMPLGLFSPLVNLIELHLENNDISAIDWRLFSTMKNLKRLYLNWNQISQIHFGVNMETPTQSIGLHLDILYLNNNKLGTLANDTFSAVSSIDSLYLQNNVINSIDETAFNGTVVRYLNLGANKLTPEHLNLGKVSGLEELVVYGNMLTLETSDYLSGLTSLRVLSMSHNHVTTISKNSFKDLVNLKELYLEGNNVIIDSLLDEISNITDLTALGLTSDTLVDFPYWLCDLYQNLSVVHITHSNITSITRELSTKCPKLQTINLKLNQISYIEPMAFSNISFRYLHLQMNQIQSIPENTFNTGADLPGFDMEIFLDLNPLVCDCNLAHILALPNVYKVTGKCAEPQDMFGIKLSSASQSQFICHTTTVTEPETTTLEDTTTEMVTSKEDTTVIFTSELVTQTAVNITAELKMETTSPIMHVTSQEDITTIYSTVPFTSKKERDTTEMVTTFHTVGEKGVTTEQSTVYVSTEEDPQATTESFTTNEPSTTQSLITTQSDLLTSSSRDLHTENTARIATGTGKSTISLETESKSLLSFTFDPTYMITDDTSEEIDYSNTPSAYNVTNGVTDTVMLDFSNPSKSISIPPKSTDISSTSSSISSSQSSLLFTDAPNVTSNMQTFEERSSVDPDQNGSTATSSAITRSQATQRTVHITTDQDGSTATSGVITEIQITTTPSAKRISTDHDGSIATSDVTPERQITTTQPAKHISTDHDGSIATSDVTPERQITTTQPAKHISTDHDGNIATSDVTTERQITTMQPTMHMTTERLLENTEALTTMDSVSEDKNTSEQSTIYVSTKDDKHVTTKNETLDSFTPTQDENIASDLDQSTARQTHSVTTADEEMTTSSTPNLSTEGSAGIKNDTTTRFTLQSETDSKSFDPTNALTNHFSPEIVENNTPLICNANNNHFSVHVDPNRTRLF